MKRRWFLLGGLAAIGGIWHERFDAIVIHHSGGTSGDLELLRRVHKARQVRDPVPMIPYHFVIGNGRGMGNGEVAKTRRWPWVWGAHLSGRNTGLNVSAIGICVIGNFETQQLGDVQFDALVALVKRLQSRYNIKAENVGFHGHTDGEQTKCPGKNFPRERVMSAIA